jgi:hypothetical protein
LECQLKNKITCRKASNSIPVIPDPDIYVGLVICVAVSVGCNNENRAYLLVSDENSQEIRDSFIEKAICDVRSRIVKVASAMDLSIIGMKSINLNDALPLVFY